MALLTLDKSNYKAYKGQQLLDINEDEFDVLWVLSTRPDRVFSEDDITLELEQEYYDLRSFSVTKIVNDLQQKLSLQNIRLISNEGFKIEFQQVFK